MTRIERMICLLALGSWCAYKAYRSSHEILFWHWLVLLIIGIAALLFFTWIARQDYARKQHVTFPTLPGTIFALTIAGLFFLQNSQSIHSGVDIALQQSPVQKDSLNILDQAKANRALQAWLVRRSPTLHTQFNTALLRPHHFAHKP